MLYELNSENILICKPVKPSLLKSVIYTDIIVTDTKPDVFHILQVNALSSINEKYVQKDIITVSGYIDFTILSSQTAYRNKAASSKSIVRNRAVLHKISQ